MNKEEVKNAVVFLASRCNFASTLDGRGFNKLDTLGGHELAGRPLEQWSEDDFERGLRYVQKYRTQLEKAGFIIPKSEREKSKSKINIATEKGWYVVGFEYNRLLVARIKEIEGRRYDPAQKKWLVPSTSREGLRRFLEENGFSSEALPEIIEKPESRSRVEEGEKTYKIFFEYNPKLVSAIREVAGRRFVRESGSEPHWTVPKTKAAMLALLPILQEGEFVMPESVKEEIMKKHEAAISNQRDSGAYSIDEPFEIDGLSGTLRPFQKACVKYIASNPKSIIADEPGLGKTIEALAAVQHLNAYPAVVVCPATLKLNWRLEAKRWLPGKTVEIWEKGNQRAADIIITNYEMMPKQEAEIRELEPKALVFDESHKLKNKKGIRTKAALALSKGIEVVLELTGTPVMNRAEELISQLKIVGHLEDLGGEWTILRRYCWNSDKTEEFNQNLRATCFVRREKDKVLDELPKKQRIVVPVAVSLANYNRRKKEVIEYIALKMKADEELMHAIEGKTKEEKKEIIQRHRKTQKVLSAILPEIESLKQSAAEAKMDSVIEWIRDFIESEKKLVVFGHHQSVVQRIASEFGVEYINQHTALKDRQRLVDDFQCNPSTKIIVGTIGTMGVGLTLTAAQDVLMVELGWNAAQMDQAEDRIHRIGQKGSATAWYIVAEGTIETELMEMIEQKRALATEITEGIGSASAREALERIIKTLLDE